MIDWGHVFDRVVEAYIALVLTVEYLWGRSDTDIKNEAKRKKKARERYSFETLNQGEHK